MDSFVSDACNIWDLFVCFSVQIFRTISGHRQETQQLSTSSSAPLITCSVYR